MSSGFIMFVPLDLFFVFTFIIIFLFITLDCLHFKNKV
uniref:Uncharacterized protein n=1 Tax=Anguilla anguilla TaxID=7936 RepID=A0A0E9R2N1_ANGAN